MLNQQAPRLDGESDGESDGELNPIRTSRMGSELESELDGVVINRPATRRSRGQSEWPCGPCTRRGEREIWCSPRWSAFSHEFQQ